MYQLPHGVLFLQHEAELCLPMLYGNFLSRCPDEAIASQ